VNVLFNEAVHSIKVKLQSSCDAPIVIDGDRDQRLNTAPDAHGRIGEKRNVHVRRAQDFSGLHGVGANGCFQADFALQGQCGSTCTGTVPDNFSL